MKFYFEQRNKYYITTNVRKHVYVKLGNESMMYIIFLIKEKKNIDVIIKGKLTFLKLLMSIEVTFLLNFAVFIRKRIYNKKNHNIA